ncbi:hypothetical protein RFI_24282 [Reticulomyxa filosa]|uniref:Uncharacterized protein n=1 Tax=Reticulomyxa filosa TaxID=46433 RepID=X6MGE3_RETFI|nr:hypothetical protein RFI_24282 [Reticulomyxa filosa]|eukprot:ETO13093.1 hypothetical protein RFI_24282 [Reticulomyxa filosa]
MFLSCLPTRRIKKVLDNISLQSISKTVIIQCNVSRPKAVDSGVEAITRIYPVSLSHHTQQSKTLIKFTDNILVKFGEKTSIIDIYVITCVKVKYKERLLIGIINGFAAFEISIIITPKKCSLLLDWLDILTVIDSIDFISLAPLYLKQRLTSVLFSKHFETHFDPSIQDKPHADDNHNHANNNNNNYGRYINNARFGMIYPQLTTLPICERKKCFGTKLEGMLDGYNSDELQELLHTWEKEMKNLSAAEFCKLHDYEIKIKIKFKERLQTYFILLHFIIIPLKSSIHLNFICKIESKIQ